MPTVIDSFVVELGLDPRKFTQGQKEAMESFKRTMEEARRRGKETEDQGRRVTQSLTMMRNQLIGVFTLFTGGRGVADFVSGIVQSDAAVGRLSRNLGISAQTISKWQGVARIFGGSAEQMAASFTTMSDAFEGWTIGIVSPLIADFRAISTAGGTIIDMNKGVEQSFLDLSKNLKTIHDRDGAARAGLLGRRAGIDPALFDVLVQGPEVTQRFLREVAKLGPATDASTKAAGELAQAWNKVGIAIEGAMRDPLAQVEHTMADMLNAVTFYIGKFHFINDVLIQGTKKWLGDRLGFGSGASTAPTSGSSPLRLKTGAGSASPAILALASSLQDSVPGLQRFTALNDSFHAGTGSKHASGNALDFTIGDASKSGATAAAIRAKLASMNVDATVLDEYANPSKRSTGGHIHVQFNSNEAAKRYADTVGGTSPGGPGASNHSSVTNINTINVNAPNATDAVGVAASLKPVLQGNSFNANNFGGAE